MSKKNNKFSPSAEEDPAAKAASLKAEAEALETNAAPPNFVVGHDEPLPERTRVSPGSKYPFEDLRPPRVDADGVTHVSFIEADRKAIKSITSAARNYAKSHPGVKFATRVVNANLARLVRVE